MKVASLIIKKYLNKILLYLFSGSSNLDFGTFAIKSPLSIKNMFFFFKLPFLFCPNPLQSSSAARLYPMAPRPIFNRVSELYLRNHL